MNKKLHVFSMLVLILVFLLAACSSSNTSNEASNTEDQGKTPNQSETNNESAVKEEPSEIVVTFYVQGPQPRDLRLVEEKVSELTLEKINTTVRLNPISIGDYVQQMNLMLSGNEQVDVLLTRGFWGFAGQVSRGHLLPMDELLEQYGQDIKEVLPEEYLQVRVGGEIYGIPTLRDMASYPGVHMRTELIEKHGIDVSQINSLEGLENALRTIKENEPGIEPLLPSAPGMAMTNMFMWFDSLGDFFGVLPHDSKDLTVVNLYETPEYENFVKTMRNWYTEGLIMSEIATNAEPVGTLYRAGQGFGHISPFRPGTEGVNSRQDGTSLTGAALGEAWSNSISLTSLMWSIPRNAKAPDKAMQFINLMYVDEELVNLLNWGIEGEHYVKVADNVVAYPEGVDASNSRYSVNMPFLWGNSFLTYIMEGDNPNLWNELQEFNEAANKSKALGFVFDPSPVSTELAALNNVRNEFASGLENGSMDPDRNLPVFIQRLRDAGIDRYIVEKQRQLDDWAAHR